jgi:hypothetical protein
MDENKRTPRPKVRFKASWAVSHSWPLTIALFCFVYALADGKEVLGKFHNSYEIEHHLKDPGTIVGRTNLLIDAQVNDLQGVDAGGLTGDFGWFLNNWNCPLIIHCISINAMPPGSTVEDRERRLAEKTSPPPSPIAIWHTVSATPRALLYTAHQIVKAGYWAIAMFLSCTVLWFLAMLREARGKTPVAALLMFVGSPLGIGLMVVCVQWLCAAALHTLGIIGALIAMGLMAMVEGTAISAMVVGHHLSKAPEEIAEGLEKLKPI